MELLYLYVEDYAEIQKQGFRFSSKIKVNYNEELKTIALSENENYIDNFYGKTISDITAIVGKNGTGKTTVLDIIGLDYKNRVEASGFYYDGKYHYKDKYFMLYYVDKNIYYIEGFGQCVINNIDSLNEILLNNHLKDSRHREEFFSFFIKKGKSNRFSIIDYTTNPYKKNKRMAEIIYINDVFDTRKKEQISYKNKENQKNILIKRNQVEKINLTEWYKTYIDFCKDNYIENKNVKIVFKKYEYRIKQKSLVVIPAVVGQEATSFLGKKSIITIETIEDFYRYFQSNIIDNMLTIYLNRYKDVVLGELRDFINDLPDKDIVNYHKEIFTFLEENTCSKMLNDIEYRNIAKYYKLMKDLFFTMLDIKDYIIPSVDSFELVLTDEFNENIEKFFTVLKEIEIFVNVNEERRNLSDKERAIADIFSTNDDDFNLFVKPFKAEGFRMSKGEEKLVTVFSKIMNEINEYVCEREIRYLHYKKLKKNITILIDEIDDSMHPEWSRNLINIIVSILDGKKETVFNKYFISYITKVQFIISTHSPFVLSDLKKDNIISMYPIYKKVLIDTDNKEIDDNKTFAQNIHNTLNKSFFMDASIGEFSRNKINAIINILNSKKKVSTKKQNEIRKTIDIIGEPVLKYKLQQMYDMKFPIKETDINNLIIEKQLLEKLLKKEGIKENDQLVKALHQVIEELDKET